MPMTIVGLGQVEYVEDGNGVNYNDYAAARRIKVRMDSDGLKSIADLPYAFPLIPKTIQSVPKVGEGVLIFCSDGQNPNSQRYYIGPIISQDQYQEYCEYKNGRGPAVSLLTDRKPLAEKPLTAITYKGEDVKGAYPNINDVALIGRGQEDIVCKYRGKHDGYSDTTSEIDLRAGIRLEPTDTTDKYYQGNVVFNNINPGYIQIKYKNNGIAGLKESAFDANTEQIIGGSTDSYESKDKRQANSIVNVVADKINLISHKAGFGESLTDNEDLVTEEQMDSIMSQMHRAVYGDELIHLLKLMVKAITTHQHPFSMLPPTIKGTDIEYIQGYDYEKLISPNVRIS